MEYPPKTPLWRRYLRFFRPDVEADVDDELRFHFEARIEELTSQGLSPAAARARAAEEFGNVAEVRQGLRNIGERMVRRKRWTDRLESWIQDASYALRSLRRAPGTTVTIVATLALGLGLNTAMFSLLNAVFLKPPGGVAAPGEVRRVWSEINFRSGKQFWPGYDYQEFDLARRELTGMAEAATYLQPDEVKLGRLAAGTTARLSRATSNYFAMLGVRPARGRFFTVEEDQLGNGAKVAVVSHAFWTRSLGSGPLGGTLLLENQSYVVIGVTPREFSGVDLDATEVWAPLATTSGYGGTPWWTDSNVNGFQVLLRLAPGVRDEAVDARLTLALQRDDAKKPALQRNAVARTGSIIAARGPGKKAQEVQIAVRLGAVSLIVLVIACANVVNLLLARALRRRREIAVRLALGISKARLARLVLTESVLLAMLAGAAATLVAAWGGVVLRRIFLPDIHWSQVPLDWRVLLAAGLATLAAGLVAGVVPAVQSGATELTDSLKAGSREGQVRPGRIRGALVVAQTALSLVLLVGAGLFVKSLSNVRSLDLGFDAGELLFARVAFESRDPARDSLVPARMAEVAERLRGAAGVEGTALTAMRPLSGFSSVDFYPDIDTLTHKKPEGMFWAVSPEYFATAGTRMVRGESFPAGSGAGRAPAVIVNEAMADALWPGENPLGRCVRFDKPEAACATVIGVVETARWGKLIEEATPQFYLPIESMPFAWSRSSRELAVRAGPGNVAGVSAQVRSALLDAFPEGVPRITAMKGVLEPLYRPWRLGATLFSLFGLLAAMVAVMGVFSTVSYSVSQRTHEFGVRVALGAQLVDIVRQGLGEGLKSVIVGILAGIALALAAGRLVASLLYGIAPGNPGVIAIVGLGLLAAALGAALIPAWRAGRVDPVSVLRGD